MTGYLTRLFADAVQAHPSAPAFVQGERTSTYEELADLSAVIGRRLARDGVRARSRIAVDGLSNNALCAAVLAVMGLDCSVVPTLLGEGVAERRRLEHLAVTHVVEVGRGGEYEVHPIGSSVGARPSRELRPPDPEEAYVISTSGSTNAPKHVPVTNGNLEALGKHLGTRDYLQPGDRIALNYGPHFDPFYGVLIAAWVWGGAMIAPVRRENTLVDSYVSRNSIDVWDSVPALLSLARRLGHLGAGSMQRVRTVVVGGETVPTDLVRAVRAASPRSHFVNAYGPTETTVTAAELHLRPGAALPVTTAGVPIGRVVQGLQHRVGECDADGVGELWLRGPQRFAGYVDPGDDVGRFVDAQAESDALAQASPIPESWWYRTGDLVRESEDGLLFVGRWDQQVKVLGRRVDLHLVEERLRAHPCVEACWVGVAGGRVVAAAARRDKCHHEEHSVDFDGFRSYSVPVRIVWTSQLPLLHNGKLDRRSIQRLVEDPLDS